MVTIKDKIKACIFDFDDTLVETTVYFNQAKDKFASIMEQLEFPVEDALVTLNQFDIENVQKCGGFAKECFPNALAQTYEHFCRKFSREVCRVIRQDLEELGWWVFEQHPHVLEGAEEVLKHLHSRYPLILATKGDPVLQAARLAASGLKDYFEQVYILFHKTEKEFRQIAQEQNLDVINSWVIGNSMKGDINPAIKAGFKGIYVYHPHTWDYEEEAPAGDYHRVRQITEILTIIEEPVSLKNRKFLAEGCGNAGIL